MRLSNKHNYRPNRTISFVRGFAYFGNMKRKTLHDFWQGSKNSDKKQKDDTSKRSETGS